ncbi:hypothetical protein NRB20_75880 [Nocardia sp. RB20]|uniref:Uncharacterized protein n=1 Tax=Nocardia macrotermitis TaxID=2585198 RepID=A0A7K0DFL4_9NOCA|nr:hypothetical protein [Nocardia macrotermitis]
MSYPLIRRLQKVRNPVVSNRPSNTVNRMSPRGEIADIALRDNRFPVRATVGVCPTRPQVAPDR